VLVRQAALAYGFGVIANLKTIAAEVKKGRK
jgi:hypothetical protein